MREEFVDVLFNDFLNDYQDIAFKDSEPKIITDFCFVFVLDQQQDNNKDVIFSNFANVVKYFGFTL